ncbi:MAG: DUF5678 domain-containing protein [Chloroflexi bacterium]|nr:DUF5678 domain-containing protein [Chloroflexota bacterium]
MGIAKKRTLLDEIVAFDAQFHDIRKKYSGRWIAMCGGKVVGDFDDVEQAESFANKRKFRNRPVLIERADESAYTPSASVWVE